jgi:hypothetical protein
MFTVECRCLGGRYTLVAVAWDNETAHRIALGMIRIRGFGWARVREI